MHIAIVDDDKKDLNHLQQTLETYAKAHEMKCCEIDAFSSGEQFLKSFEAGKYALIFFDNYIGNTLGINLAQKVRALDEAVEIAFVSMSAEFAVSGFAVRAIHYLMKPITAEEVGKVFARMGQKALKYKAPEMVELVIDRESTNLSVDVIQYIEVIDKACVLYGPDGEPRTYMKLENLMELLPRQKFIRTHRSYAVNLAFIKQMDSKGFLLKNGVEIPIGRTYQSDCRRAYMQHLASQ